jgi:nitrilase
MAKIEVYRAAAVQAAPAFLDLAQGVKKTIQIIADAAAQDVKLLAFPEAWLPGYPFWSWLGSQAWGMQFIGRYHENSIVTGSAEMQAIADAAAKHKMTVVLGTSERDHGTLYLGQSIIAPDGSIIAHRRKLKPTHVERTVYGEGDGSDLKVHETPLGRLGALCCWEHLQPLVKYAMYTQHEQVHVAAWPGFALYDGAAYALGPDLNTAVSQVYAAEGQCFVVAATAIVTPQMREILCDTPDKEALLPLGGGRSMIFGPDGRPLAAFLAPDAEGLVIADIDVSAIAFAKSAADPVGHYARPDVLRLQFNNKPRSPVEPLTPTVVAPLAEQNQKDETAGVAK